MSGLEFTPLLVDLWACLPGSSLPCWQEHGFEGPGQDGGTQSLTSCGGLWQPVAGCGGLWRISDTPLRWYKVGCILQPAA